MPLIGQDLYDFGPYRADPAELRLLRNKEVVSITPKVFETLCVLLENAGHVVSKDELMKRIWPDTYVEETNLAQNISTLRKALGERPDGGHYIETVPKRGYRFVAQVTKHSARSHSSQSRAEDLETAEFSLGAVRDSDVRTKRPPPTDGGRIKTTGARFKSVIPGMRIGHYEVLRSIGAGGMGEVYLARDTRLDRNVALKILSRRLIDDEKNLRRFIREAKTISALNHPNILTVYEIRNIDGFHFIATEFIEGQTLRQMLGSGALPLMTAVEIAIQVAGALEAAHEAGVVHRDVKPENIMVRPDGYAKVLDFGLAKLVRRDSIFNWGAATTVGNETDAGLIVGTVDYMSPEQARGLSINYRTDLFSFGAVLYEMLTGRAPFAAETKSDVLINVIQRDPLPVSNLQPSLGTTFDSLIERVLAKDRRDRIESAQQIQSELKQIRQEIATRSFGAADGGRSSHTSATRRGGDFARRPPEIRYARSGDVNIAYQVVGDAPLDLVFVMGWVSHLEYFWADPLFARFLNRLASFSRLIVFDKRGTGLSDRVPLCDLPTLEQRMDDVRAVMDAVGSEHAVLCGVSEGGPLCSLFAACYPEKVTALVMIGTYAKRVWAPDYPWAPTAEQREHFFEEIRQQWGGPVGIEERAPSLAHDPAFRDWWATYLRMGASPGAALALTQMNAEIDVRQVLPTIRVPTLILHRTGDLCLKVEEGRYVAQSIPGAKFVELPGVDHLPFVGDQEAILDEIEEFLTGVRHSDERDKVLVTVLVAGVVDREVQSQAFGHARWQTLVAHFRDHIRREINLFKGREVENSGEEALATFDGPARAIRAASAITDTAKRLGIEVRTGLHTGECEIHDDGIRGLAVDIGIEISLIAPVGEVYVSSTVKDLVAGSGISFSERGSRTLPGVPGEWRIFSVERQ